MEQPPSSCTSATPVRSPTTPRLSAFERRDIVERARSVLEVPAEALALLDTIPGSQRFRATMGPGARWALEPPQCAAQDPALAAAELFVRGLCLGNAHRHEEAFALGEALAQAQPSRSEGPFLLAMAQGALDFGDEAQRTVRRAMELDAVMRGDAKAAESHAVLRRALTAQKLARMKLRVLHHAATFATYVMPRCRRCHTTFLNPTVGWFCPHCQRETGQLVRVWEPDNESRRCSGCDRNVRFMFSRHHCRSCGRLVCGGCSKHAMPVPALLIKEPTRVCDACVRHFTEESRAPRTPLRLRDFTPEELGLRYGCAERPTLLPPRGTAYDAAGETTFSPRDRSASVVSEAPADNESFVLLGSFLPRSQSLFEDGASSSGARSSVDHESQRQSQGGGAAAHDDVLRYSNVHACLKAAYERLFTATAQAYRVSGRDDPEVALVRWLMPYQDVFRE